MAIGPSYDAIRTRVRDAVAGHEAWLQAMRRLRCVLVQGPWQPWLVGRYRRRAANPALPLHDRTLFPQLDARPLADALERDAYAPGFRLPEELVDEIVAFTRADGAWRVDNPHLRCAAAERLAHDPGIVAVARAYLGIEPILLETKIFWTRPQADETGRATAPAEDGLFHYDLVDVKAVTVFVYLTDVDADSSPHVVIPGTQSRRTPAQILRRSLGDREAVRRWGDRIRVVTGPRGTGWFEDITTYHKQAGGTKPRLMLTLLYSMHRRPAARAVGAGAPVRALPAGGANGPAAAAPPARAV